MSRKYKSYNPKEFCFQMHFWLGLQSSYPSIINIYPNYFSKKISIFTKLFYPDKVVVQACKPVVPSAYSRDQGRRIMRVQWLKISLKKQWGSVSKQASSCDFRPCGISNGNHCCPRVSFKPFHCGVNLPTIVFYTCHNLFWWPKT